MINEDGCIYEILVNDHCEAPCVGRWLWILENIEGLSPESKFSNYLVLKRKAGSMIPSCLMLTLNHSSQACAYVFGGHCIPCVGECSGDLKENLRRRRTSSAADEISYGIREDDDFASIHPDLRVRWRFSQHRIIIVIDVKASLGAVVDLPSRAPALALHHLLDAILSFISAISKSQAACSEPGGVLLSVIAQGSRIADLHVFCHGAQICPSTAADLLGRLRAEMEPACIQLLSSVIDPPAAGRQEIGMERSDLCHLLVTSMGMLDTLSTAACPSVVLATDGSVGAINTERLYDAAACLRRSDVAVGILLHTPLNESADLADCCGSETYGHVPDTDNLRRLALACGGFLLPCSSIVESSTTALAVAEGLMFRETCTRAGGPCGPPTELSGRPVHILSSTDYIPPMSGEGTGNSGGVGAELRRALSARLREGFLPDAVGEVGALSSWSSGTDLRLPLDCGLELVAQLRLVTPFSPLGGFGLRATGPCLRISVGWRADDALQRFLLAGTRDAACAADSNVGLGGSPPYATTSAMGLLGPPNAVGEGRRGRAAGRASRALLRLRRLGDAVLAADRAHRVLAGPDGPAPVWALQGLPAVALTAAAAVYSDHRRVELIRTVTIEVVTALAPYASPFSSLSMRAIAAPALYIALSILVAVIT